MDFGERLVDAFDGASMAEIARRLDVAHSSVRNYVQQNRLPDAEVLIKITNRTNVSLHWLLTGNGAKSNESKILGDLSGRFSKEDLAALDDLRMEWEANRGFAVSWDDFIQTLTTWGELGVRNKIFKDEIEQKFETPEYASSRESILAQSVTAIIRHELSEGTLRDLILDIVEEVVAGAVPVQELGTIDEVLANSIERDDNPGTALEAVFRWKGWPMEEISVPQFSGWDTWSVEQKVKELRAFINIDIRHRERQAMFREMKKPK